MPDLPGYPPFDFDLFISRPRPKFTRLKQVTSRKPESSWNTELGFQISGFKFQISDCGFGQVTVKRSGVPESQKRDAFVEPTNKHISPFNREVSITFVNP